MPKWLSTTMIVIGFLALVGLAFFPRNVEINVTVGIDERGASFVNDGNPFREAAPEKSDED